MGGVTRLGADVRDLDRWACCVNSERRLERSGEIRDCGDRGVARPLSEPLARGVNLLSVEELEGDLDRWACCANSERRLERSGEIRDCGDRGVARPLSEPLARRQSAVGGGIGTRWGGLRAG